MVRKLVGSLLLALCAGAAQAQARIEAEPSIALECLQVPAGEPGEPVYPFEQYKGGVPGRVKATVTLPGGLFGNEIEIQSNEGDAAFVDASRRFLRSLSAPCLKPGEKVRLAYEFVFAPDRRQVIWATPQDMDSVERAAMTSCLRTAGGVLFDGRKVDAELLPPYPSDAIRGNLQGRVRVLLTFSSPETAPAVDVLHRPSAEPFAEALREWAAGLRLPCHTGEPFRMSVIMVYRIAGSGAYGFKPLTLIDLLGLSKGIQERRLALDTTTMGCPFQLKLTYFQPQRRNVLGEVGGTDPRRRPLLELLAGLELDLRRAALDSVFADTADIAVPCLRINLNDPKEKTS